MAENSMKPRIRFKGYTDAWEQREFNSIVKRVTEMAATDGLPRVEYEDIVSGQGTLNKDIYKKQSNKVGILFDDGDVLFGKLRPYLKNWLFAAFKGIAVGDFWVLRANNADGEYIYTLLQIDTFQNIANQATGTKMPRADWSLVSKQQFFIPRTIAEQHRIGVVFKQLDNLITLHQRKYDKFVNIKKALLEKMFPQGDETTPKIRFKGFTDAWEQRKLGNTIDFYSGLTYSPSDVVKDNGVFVLRSSNVREGEIVEEDNVYVRAGAVNSDNVNIGDIIVVVRNGSRSLIGKHAKIKKNMPQTVIGAFMTGLRYENSSYLNAVLNTSIFEKEIEKDLGATINQITTGAFKKMVFPFPKQHEQLQIGDFFEQIDNLITLHQRQLEKLKNIKSALLEKMFV